MCLRYSCVPNLEVVYTWLFFVVVLVDLTLTRIMPVDVRKFTGTDYNLIVYYHLIQ